MIRIANEKDHEAIYHLWQNNFSNKSKETMTYFFDDILKEGKVVVCEKDDKIVATVFMRNMNVMFHGKPLKSVFLSFATSHPDYRKTNVLESCMKSVLDECEKSALFTFVEATSFKFWENYGFQEALSHRYYELDQRHFEKVKSGDVSEDATSEELKEIYDAFMKHFDGYKMRTLDDFDKMIQECKQTNERILIVRYHSKPMGYIRFVVVNKQVKVKEVVYLRSNAFLKLCKAALSHYECLLLELSEAEHIERLFPLAIARKRVAIMVRCNHFPLFNKLFNSKVKTSKDAYNLSKKPKFMNEKF